MGRRKVGTALVGGARPKVTKARKNSLTPAKQRAFLAHLAATCNVTRSCKAARCSLSGIYALRKRSAGFRAGWAEAISEGYGRLELELLDRAMNGTVKTIDKGDGRIETIREYPNAIALQLLRMHRDTAAQAEARHEPEEIEKVRERILRKLEKVRGRIEAGEEG